MGMQRDWSSYVIADPCIGLKDATCLEVCPVDCIESTPESPQYYINPELCIVCEQCVLVCPVDAIYLEHELPEEWKPAIERNAAFFREVAAATPLVVLEEAPVAPRSSRAEEPGARLALKVQHLRSGRPYPDRARMEKNQPGSTWRKRWTLKSSPPTASTSPT